MTAQRERRCLRTTFAIRMYHLFNKVIEGLPSLMHASDLRLDIASSLVPESVPFSYRSDDTPLSVNLAESKTSWAGSDAFEVRWTSLAA